MEKEEAKELLSFHSLRNSDVSHPKWQNGFLGSLRPFCGELREENFIEVMECMRTLEEEISDWTVERETVSDIVAIIHLTRGWVSSDGMLGSNGLLTAEQTDCLLGWAAMLENCFLLLLEDDPEKAFWEYEEYRNNRNF